MIDWHLKQPFFEILLNWIKNSFFFDVMSPLSFIHHTWYNHWIMFLIFCSTKLKKGVKQHEWKKLFKNAVIDGLKIKSIGLNDERNSFSRKKRSSSRVQTPIERKREKIDANVSFFSTFLELIIHIANFYRKKKKTKTYLFFFDLNELIKKDLNDQLLLYRNTKK